MSKFPCSLNRNITRHSMKNLAFHSLLRWKMIIQPYISLKKVGRMYFLNLGVKGLESRSTSSALRARLFLSTFAKKYSHGLTKYYTLYQGPVRHVGISSHVMMYLPNRTWTVWEFKLSELNGTHGLIITGELQGKILDLLDVNLLV